MTSPIAIRLSDADRATLEAAAQETGQGVSGYLRRIAEEEARRIRAERVRDETRRVVASLDAGPDAQAEAELLTTAREDWPEWTGPLPGQQ